MRRRKSAVRGRRKLGLEKPASTSGVRTHGDFGIIPSPLAVDIGRKITGKIMIKQVKRNTLDGAYKKNAATLVLR